MATDSPAGSSHTNTDPVDALARRLISARTGRTAIEPPGADLLPPDQATAETVDDRVAEITGWPVRGWKIGCTSVVAQQLMGASGPFAGRVFTVQESGAELDSDELTVEPRLEGEFAFTLATDLAPTDEPRSPTELATALADVRPSIEVVGGRLIDFLASPLTAVIADAGANSLVVLGPAARVPSSQQLAATTARMEVNGEVTGSGSGADVLGGPLEALAWLVANLSARGITLEAGQVVTTGTATQVTVLPAGATATATLDGIGSVSVRRSA